MKLIPLNPPITQPAPAVPEVNPTVADRHMARMLVLRELRELGYLDGLTLQYLGDIWDVNRSTILRELRILDQAERLLPEMRAAWNNANPPMKDKNNGHI